MIIINSNKRLNIFIDESGDFGFQEKSSQLYCVSFVLHESDNDIKNNLDYLNARLEKIGFKGMIHSSDLMANRREYTKFTLEERRKIFWLLFNFIKKAKLKLHTIIVDKKYKNRKTQLRKKLKKEIMNFFKDINSYMEGFKEIVIYYDNGQETLGNIIDSLIVKKESISHIIEFDHKENRLFQIADMITCIDKVIYEYNNKSTISKVEKFFFEYKDIKNIKRYLKNHRI